MSERIAITKIFICGASEVDDYRACGLSHIIRIVNTGVDDLHPTWFKGKYLQLCFGDVVSEDDALNYKTKAPNQDDLKKAILFARQAFSLPENSILVSCDYVSFFTIIHPPEPLIFQGHSPTPFSRAFTHLG